LKRYSGLAGGLCDSLREKQQSSGAGLFWKPAAMMGGARLERATSYL
jgi:hypothetical protein